MDTEEKQPKKFGWNKIWWVLILALLGWNLMLVLPKGQTSADISYSTFLDQVKSGNVSEVTLSGSEIDGKFIQPISVPIPVTGIGPNGAPVQPKSETVSTTQFRTTFPETVGDSNLMSLLAGKNVVINVTPPPSPLLSILLTYGLPLILLVALMVWMGRRMQPGQGNNIFSFAQSKARMYSEDRPHVTFGDVAGADEAKNQLREVVDFLRDASKYHKIGARIPHGVLLVGPPGTGKTLLARAVAGEAHVPFFSISASEFVEMFVGVGASRVRHLFEQARAAAPAIVFVDELDAVGRRRGSGLGSVNDEREQTLNQLLVEMDGFDDRQEVILMAATNRPDVLDPALLRPGRFDRHITVDLPDRNGREGILRIHTRGLSLSPVVSLDRLAQATTGFSGADLANLCNEAALIAARENHEQISMDDFEHALDRVLLGDARPALLDQHERKLVAYHEAGHALVAWLTPAADPVHKVTIIPHGRALGVTEQLPGDDHYNYSREYLMARLAVMLGGRGSEEIVFHDLTTGAEKDLIEATKLARRMVTRWGMGDLGPMALATDEENPFLGYELSQGREYSEETASRIDENIQHLLNENYESVKELLMRSREKLDALVEVLLKEETADQDALTRILGERVTSDVTPPVGELNI